MNGSDDGRSEFSTRWPDRDGRTSGHGRAAAQLDWLAQAEAQRIEAEIRAEAAFKARQVDWAQTEARNEGLDGLHSRQAEKEALSAGGLPKNPGTVPE